MQNVTLLGRLGKDAREITSSNTGEKFYAFNLACDGFYKGEKKTTWYDVVLPYSKRNESFWFPKLKKGFPFIVSGELDLSLYDGANGKGIRASVMAHFIDFGGGSKKDDEETSEPPKDTEAPKEEKKKTASKTTKKEPEDIPMTSGGDDDDLPF